MTSICEFYSIREIKEYLRKSDPFYKSLIGLDLNEKRVIILSNLIPWVRQLFEAPPSNDMSDNSNSSMSSSELSTTIESTDSDFEDENADSEGENDDTENLELSR